MCKASRHADAFYYFDLQDVYASGIRCVCYYIWMLFIYLDLRDTWSPLLSPLRLPVPSRLVVEVLDSTACFTFYVFFVCDNECETVQVNVKVFMDFHRFLSLAHEVLCRSPRATMPPWLNNHEDIRTRFYHSTHSHSSARSIAAHFSQSAREMGHPSYCGSEKI